MGALIRTAEPAVEPVTPVEGKLHERVDHTADDALITSLLLSARRWVESYTARGLITQTWRWELDAFPRRSFLLVPLAPLVSVSEIRTVDEDGAEAVFAADQYLVDKNSEPARIVLKSGASWPAVTLQRAAGVRITLVVGYGAAATAVPEQIKLAIKMLMGTWYDNRESVSREDLKHVPDGTAALLGEYAAWNAYGHAQVSQEDAS